MDSETSASPSRTYVSPAVAGGLVRAGVQLGVEVPLVATEHAGATAFFLIWGLWYLLFRVLEQGNPALGAFLGATPAPVYELPQGGFEFHETVDPATGEVVERHSITRYTGSASG